MFIQLKDHKAHLFIKNDLDASKKNFVFIPGAGMDHRTLSMFKFGSLEEEYNIVAIDLPGHGYTSGPLIHDVEGHTKFCMELFEHIELNNPIFVGHSWGGLVALDLSLKVSNSMTICMNIAYPFLVGDLLLEHAKGNLDQAVEFLTKYGVYKLPEIQIKTQGFGVKGSGFYGRTKGEIKSPYGTKTVESDPEREIKLYPLKRLFNQTQKEISSIDLKSCNKYRLRDSQLDELNNVKFIFCDKDKLARYDADNNILKNLDLEKDIFILNETGHFPFFEDPDQLEVTLLKILSSDVK
ncbi:MAG: alpha/beta hydrolase [Gammaproteobacteria bacterium]